MKTFTYDRWWLHERRVDPSDDSPDHDDDCCDHRHFISELNLGWKFWTLAGRVEEIVWMEPVDTSEYWWRIRTSETIAVDPDWSWRYRSDERVHALHPTGNIADPHLRFIELTGHGRDSMHIAPATGYETPDFTHELAAARIVPHEGWRMVDRPDGGDEVVTWYSTKAKARAALIKAGQLHAKILGLELVKEETLAHR